MVHPRSGGGKTPHDRLRQAADAALRRMADRYDECHYQSPHGPEILASILIRYWQLRGPRP